MGRPHSPPLLVQTLPWSTYTLPTSFPSSWPLEPDPRLTDVHSQLCHEAMAVAAAAHLPPVDDDRCCRPWCWHGSDHLRSPCCSSRSCSAHELYFSRRRGAAAANLLVWLVRWSVVHDAQVGLLHPLDDRFTCRGADARPHLRLDLPLLSCCCSNCCDCCCLLKPLCAHSWLVCSCCMP